jgi:hypothetical protein
MIFGYFQCSMETLNRGDRVATEPSSNNWTLGTTDEHENFHPLTGGTVQYVLPP